MSTLSLPFSPEEIRNAITVYEWTPFFLYSESAIQESSARLQAAFQKQGFGSFQNHFAVKANPNRHVLQAIARTWMGMDCSSISELNSAEAVGVTGEDIMFSSNNTREAQFARAKELWAIINLDDVSHIRWLERVGIPELVCCRWNPWDLAKWNGLIWSPRDIKFWMIWEMSSGESTLTTPQIIEAFKILQQKWVKRFGLHTMVVTDERRVEALVETARLLFTLAHQIHTETGIKMEFINLWWGISVPYTPEQDDVDLWAFTLWVRQAYDRILTANNAGSPAIKMENGRLITWNAGAFITRVINVATKSHRFIGLDGGMQDFPRPGRVKAYHHISVLEATRNRRILRQILHGSLCIWSDIFTPSLKSGDPPWRDLPELYLGDLIAIHWGGAHAHATWYNYNGQPRCGEVMIMANTNTAKIIRYPQTEEQLHWGVPPLK